MFLVGIIWSFWRTFKVDNVLKEVVIETCTTTSMVFIILLGAAMLTSGFGLLEEKNCKGFSTRSARWILDSVYSCHDSNLSFGIFLDFIEIAVVVVPIIAPIIWLRLAQMSAPFG